MLNKRTLALFAVAAAASLVVAQGSSEPIVEACRTEPACVEYERIADECIAAGDSEEVRIPCLCQETFLNSLQACGTCVWQTVPEGSTDREDVQGVVDQINGWCDSTISLGGGQNQANLTASAINSVPSASVTDSTGNSSSVATGTSPQSSASSAVTSAVSSASSAATSRTATGSDTATQTETTGNAAPSETPTGAGNKLATGVAAMIGAAAVAILV
ncbi:hypothetical protein ACM66B_004916 [Microbotryomycetes sp. NB124-2]